MLLVKDVGDNRTVTKSTNHAFFIKINMRNNK